MNDMILILNYSDEFAVEAAKGSAASGFSAKSSAA